MKKGGSKFLSITDSRLFIHDPGNQRTIGVRLNYHTDHKTAMKEIPAK